MVHLKSTNYSHLKFQFFVINCECGVVSQKSPGTPREITSLTNIQSTYHGLIFLCAPMLYRTSTDIAIDVWMNYTSGR